MTNTYEMVAFILYFVLVIGVGIYFYFTNKAQNEKDYFLGGRNMNGIVSAFSAGASDMSAWVLMGLPGSIFLYGMGQVWISIGLFIGTVLSWIFVAPNLRRYTIETDSITIPEFLTKRFNVASPIMRVSCAVVFMIGYALYAGSSVFACGQLFNMLIPAVDQRIAMVIAAIIILVYTLLGGFNAVSWTDFFQGMLMLMALMVVPIVAFFVLKATGSVGTVVTPENYYNLLPSGKFDWASISTMLTGMGWGLGYFGMPHIIVRFMAIKSEKELRKSQIIGSTWTGLILLMATLMALVAHEYLGDSLEASSKNLVFVNVVRNIFDKGALALIGGIIISAIVAASMSTADSQLLASSNAFASDLYKTTINKKASDKQVLAMGRYAVAGIAIVALIIALITYEYKLGGIMELVSAAWSIFGASFGPAILLALFWRRFNYKGAVAAVITGFLVSILWMAFFNLEYYGFKSLVYNTNLYEIIPGFICSLVVGFAVSSLTEKPSQEVESTFDKVKSIKHNSLNK